jgi:5'-3' exonuclease
MKKLTAYLDADILLYRACSFCDSEFDGEPMGDYKQAEYFFDFMQDRWIEEASKAGKIEDFYLVVSHGRTFRKDLYSEYKANRKDIVPHPAFHDLKKSIMERVGVIWEENMEADDLIGIRVTEDPDNTIAISADKDFATIPCQLYVPASHGKLHGSRFSFTEDEANMNWMRQALTGDTIDNYKGIPGIGPKKAEKIIPGPAPLHLMWAAVEGAFINAGLTSEDAILMSRLARILRAGDYDFDTKETKLWTPLTNSKSETQLSVTIPDGTPST